MRPRINLERDELALRRAEQRRREDARYGLATIFILLALGVTALALSLAARGS